jgi:hypothetical protein
MIARLAAVLVLAAGTAHAGRADRTVPAQDSIDHLTDTHVDLVAGLWHDDDLVPGVGWHLYHFTPDTDGPIAFQMRAEPDNRGLWSYLRIVDTSAHDQGWAGVANRKTNLCEVIVEVVHGHHYDVITTSQQSAVLTRHQKQTSRGRYTVAALPLHLAQPVAAAAREAAR